MEMDVRFRAAEYTMLFHNSRERVAFPDHYTHVIIDAIYFMSSHLRLASQVRPRLVRTIALRAHN